MGQVMKIWLSTGAIFGLTALLLSGCMPSSSGNVYTSAQARQAHTMVEGVVVSVKSVSIQDEEQPMVGTLAGGLVGGVLGSTVGSGSGKNVAMAMGALIGAGGGAALQKMMGSKAGLEILVKLDSGQSVAVVQEADVPFEPGERVQVLTGPDGTTRVSK